MGKTEIVESYTQTSKAGFKSFTNGKLELDSMLGLEIIDLKLDSIGSLLETALNSEILKGCRSGVEGCRYPSRTSEMGITMISVQGDTEFASVEQQNHLLATAPTEYDRKSALRIMCEEQRHGWQMAYLLCTYFGEQGVREAAKLERMQDGTRLLGSFNAQSITSRLLLFYSFYRSRWKYQLRCYPLALSNPSSINGSDAQESHSISEQVRMVSEE